MSDTSSVILKYPPKPANLELPDLIWKFIINGATRGKNILMTGVSGSGKTSTAKAIASALGRQFFYVNLGSTQDPRLTLIGGTHFNPTDGTYFHQSTFVRAIQVPGAVILLDEVSRAHPEAWNILMTVLDDGQRYIRLDESNEIDNVIQVAEGVTFIGTANIGREYTSTRQMDKALLDRFVIVEMPTHDKRAIHSLLVKRLPELSDRAAEILSSIYTQVRMNLDSDRPTLSNQVSIRALINTAEYLLEDFTFSDAVSLCIYPFFPDGGVNSERAFIKQIIQQYGTDKLDARRVPSPDSPNTITPPSPINTWLSPGPNTTHPPINTWAVPGPTGPSTMTPDQMQQIIDSMQSNVANNGSVDDHLKAYNTAIQTMDHVEALFNNDDI